MSGSRARVSCLIPSLVAARPSTLGRAAALPRARVNSHALRWSPSGSVLDPWRGFRRSIHPRTVEAE